MSRAARCYNLPIDLLKDLEPVALICTQPSMIVGKKDLPANNLKELIAWLKEQFRQGVGRHRRSAVRAMSPACSSRTPSARSSSSFRIAAPGCRMQDLVAGQIDMMMDTAATSGGHVQAA